MHPPNGLRASAAGLLPIEWRTDGNQTTSPMQGLLAETACLYSQGAPSSGPRSSASPPFWCSAVLRPLHLLGKAGSLWPGCRGRRTHLLPSFPTPSSKMAQSIVTPGTWGRKACLPKPCHRLSHRCPLPQPGEEKPSALGLLLRPWRWGQRGQGAL